MVEHFFDEQREQSEVKAEIVAKYFDAWAQIITGAQKSRPDREQRIGYIDLFSGPGRYKDGSISTPLKVLKKAIDNDAYRDRLLTSFNDRDPSNVSNLVEEIRRLPGIEKLKHQPQVANEEVGDEVAAQWEKMRSIPVLVFIDPWGYKGLSQRLIQAFVKDWGSDCILFFNYTRINMGLNNLLVQEHMDALFGPERAARLRAQLGAMDAGEREAVIVEELAQALKEYGSTRFVLPFCFKNAEGKRTTHHLVFVSKHFKGYEVMKEVMAKASSEAPQGVPSFSFFPNPPARQQLLFELSRPLADLEGMLLRDFAGRKLRMIEVYQEHSVGRPFIKKNYKDVLAKLATAGTIKTEGRKRNFGFGDQVVVEFPA
ncbi:MAG: three-Cys-motif partner protein TcmP [Planctomycetes bacterium]|nr:three-Cys-motif partner protein TcmP [Planctomycetota bacterium]